MRNKAIQCAIIFIMIGSLVIVAVLLSSEGFSKINKLDSENDRGTFLILEKELVPREEIEAFLVADGFFFIFYDAAGIVNIYSVDGAFQYGIQVFTSTNGRGTMRYSDGKLYIESRLNVRYVFEKDVCKQCIAYEYGVNSEDYDQLDHFFQNPVSTEWAGVQYLLSSNQSEVVKINKDLTEETVLKLPRRSPYVSVLLTISGISLLVAYQLRDKNRKIS